MKVICDELALTVVRPEGAFGTRAAYTESAGVES